MKKVAFIVICCILASIFATLVVLVAVSDIEIENSLKSYFQVNESFATKDIEIIAYSNVNINIVGKNSNENVEVSYSPLAAITVYADPMIGRALIKIYEKDSGADDIQTLNVVLPSEYCNRLTINAESSYTNIKNASVGNLTVYSHFGDLTMQNVQCSEELNVCFQSGSMQFNNVSSSHIDAFTGGGEIEGNEIYGGGTRMENINGSINVGHIYGRWADICTGAGSINCYGVFCTRTRFSVDDGSIVSHIYGVKKTFTITLPPDLTDCNLTAQEGTEDRELTIEHCSGSVNITFSEY